MPCTVTFEEPKAPTPCAPLPETRLRAAGLGIAYDLRKRPKEANPGSCYWEFWFDGADVVEAIAVGKLEVKGGVVAS